MPFIDFFMEKVTNLRLSGKEQAILLLMLSMGYGIGHVAVSLTDSLAYRIFWYSRNAEALQKVHTGSYVAFEKMAPAPVNRIVRMIKRVGCSEGEMLTVDENKNYLCKEEYLGHAKDRTCQGAPATAFRYNGVIPAGKIFVIGDKPDSYDSRYYGFLDKSSITEALWPIL